MKNKIVHKLVNEYKIICFQDENISSWKENGHGKSIQFSAIGGIISALKRKAVTPIVVEKYYPSTQICSKCGNKQKMNKRIRTYNCVACNCSIDRDINAAINIEKEGLGINKIPMECREFKPVGTRTSFSILETKLEKVQSMNQETHGSSVLG